MIWIFQINKTPLKQFLYLNLELELVFKLFNIRHWFFDYRENKKSLLDIKINLIIKINLCIISVIYSYISYYFMEKLNFLIIYKLLNRIIKFIFIIPNRIIELFLNIKLFLNLYYYDVRRVGK